MTGRPMAADDFDFIRARRDELRTEATGKVDILKRAQMEGGGARFYRYYAVTQKGFDTMGTARDWWSQDYDGNYRAKTPGIVIVEGAELAQGEKWQRFTPDGREFTT